MEHSLLNWDTSLEILQKIRSHFPSGEGTPVSEEDLAAQEGFLGYRLPSLLRTVYKLYGTTDIQALLSFEGQLNRRELDSLNPKREKEKFSGKACFFSGNYYFVPGSEDDPPVYLFRPRDEPTHVKISNSLSAFFAFLLNEYDQIVFKQRLDLIPKHLVLAGVGQPEEFKGFTETEISELEKKYAIELPEVYKSFLRLFGKGFPPMRSDSFVHPFDELYDLEVLPGPPRKSVCTEPNSPEDAVYFGNIHSIGTFYFRLSEGDNPPVYSGRDRAYHSLSDFFYAGYREVLDLGGRLIDERSQKAKGGTWQLYQKFLL